MEPESEDSARATKRADRDLLLYERKSRYLRKRSEDYQVMEEVFDKPTLMVLYSLRNDGYFLKLHGAVGSGKESKVYRGETVEGQDIAVKIYLTVSSAFKRRLQYVVGDPRFASVKKGSRNIAQVWARKEYASLAAAYRAGVPVPKPIACHKNVLLMEFIGDGGSPAPTIGNLKPSRRDYRSILKSIETLHRDAHLVHADLSEFNIFKHRGRLVLFDLGSTVDRDHPSGREFLIRDIQNVNRFYEKRGLPVRPVESILKEVEKA